MYFPTAFQTVPYFTSAYESEAGAADEAARNVDARIATYIATHMGTPIADASCQAPPAPDKDANITLVNANIRDVQTVVASEHFTAISTLSLTHPDAESLAFLAAFLVEHPQAATTLQLHVKDPIAPETMARLGDRALKALVLDYGDEQVDPAVLTALAHSNTPISLRGEFPPHAFLAASHIPTLTHLCMTGRGFDDNYARWLSCHPRLEVLSLGANWNLSARSIESIAALPQLRELRVNEFLAPLITDRVAAVLAESSRFESLEVHCVETTLSPGSVAALSKSLTLTTLRVPIAAPLQHFSALASVEHLAFHRTNMRSTVTLDAASAAAIASLPRLKSLVLPTLSYEKGALAILLGRTGAENMTFNGDHAFETGAIVALSYNERIKALTIKDASLSAANIAAMVRHPTLERLTISNLEFIRKSGHPTLSLVTNDVVDAPADPGFLRSML